MCLKFNQIKIPPAYRFLLGVSIFFVISFFCNFSNNLKANNKNSFKELDRWYEVFLDDSKVGYSHSTMKLGNNEVLSKTTFVMFLKRAGVSIEVKSMESTRETFQGDILSFSGEIKMAGVPVIKNGKVEGNEIVIKEKQFFRETEKRYPLDPDGKMTWGFLKLIRENNFKLKDIEFETKVYSADFGMVSPTKAIIRSMGKSEIIISGEKKEVFKTEISMLTTIGEIKTVNWLDEWGFAVKTKMQLGGLRIEIRQSNEIDAKKISDPPEFLINTLVLLKKEIPQNAQEINLLVKVVKGDLSTPILQNENQKVTFLNKRSFIINIRAEKWGQIKNGRKQIFKVGQEYRSSNLMIDSDDPLIRQLAKNAGKGSKNIIELSEKLYSFAQNYLIHKNFKVGFASASETAKKREGDCTEHAVFLAALGRSMGIPTRVASGLLYMNSFKGKKHVMVYHMWTEFHLKGKWVRLDSALGKIGTHADRITLSVSSLNQENMAELGIGITEMIGNLSVQVDKIKFRVK